MSASIILLCEDQRTDQFVRRFLRHRKFRTHDIHTVPLPAKGSGEQWVREQYPKELQSVRRKKQTVLLVVTDANTNATADRRSRLDRQCDTEEVRKRQPTDPVIIAIPRRNIETWLWHLKTGEVVNEVRDYKPRFRKLNTAGLHELADSLYRMCDREQSLLPTAPPSLKEACLEYPTFTRFLR